MRDVTLSDIEQLRADAAAADTVFEMDEEAFRALYDRTARSLWVYLSRMTGSADAADDLLQETYYRFLRSRPTHENDAHRRHTLFRIATNLARDGRRRNARARFVPIPDQEAMTVEFGAAGDVAGDAQRRADVGRALAHLRPRERAMLWLAYAQGSNHRDIAGAVGVKVGSVKLLLFRARQKLARLLGGSIAEGRRQGGRS